MKRAMNGQTIGDPPFAVSLGADFVAEHEQGVEGVTRIFGIDATAAPGIERRRARPLEGEMREYLVLEDFEQTKTMRAETRLLFTADTFTQARGLQRKPEPFERGRRSDKLECYWDQGSFLIRAFRSEDRAFLHTLHDALTIGDAAIGQGVAGPLRGTPLTMAVVSMMPSDVLANLEKVDLDHDALLSAARRTGIADRLRAAGLAYYALSPALASDFQSTHHYPDVASATRHDVLFFLNPARQDRNNHGWFTVEDLDLWIAGEGPVIRRNEQEAAPSP